MSFEYQSLLSIPSVFPDGPETDAEFKKYDRLRARVKRELEDIIGARAHAHFGGINSYRFPLSVESTDLQNLLDKNGFYPLAVNGEEEDLEALLKKIREMSLRTEAQPSYPVLPEGRTSFRRLELPAVSIDGQNPKCLDLHFGHLRQVGSGWQIANSSSGEIKNYPLSDLTYFKAE